MRRPPLVRALQLVGCFCIAVFFGGTHIFTYPTCVLLGLLWFFLIEISWETRFPW